MHTIKITPNLLFEYQCTSGKFIKLPNRIESKKIDSVVKIKSNRIGTFFARIGMLYCEGAVYNVLCGVIAMRAIATITTTVFA